MSKPLVVFTYAPAGLGHIRVSDALMDALPSEFDSVVFSPSNRSIEVLHRFGSLNIFARRVMEWFQNGTPEKIFTKYYRKFLKNRTDGLLLEFISLVKSQKNTPETIIIVSTHFSLAHQLGRIKEELAKSLNAEIKLVVQITDDSPQSIWYVDSADLIIAPSEKTANILKKYGTKENLSQVPFKVLPYPVIPLFSRQLSDQKILFRQEQYNPDSFVPINIVIPISGAAVGMNFFIQTMEKIHLLSNRFVFFVICRKAPFTQKFINNIQNKSYVNLFVSEKYQDVVHMYNNIYLKNVISAEITKPSEQAFKALLDNDSVGGSFLFFANPVGRQEYDNLKFLKKNGLLSSNPRGIILPKDPDKSSKFIYELYQNGFLLKAFKKFKPVKNKPEIDDDGATLFWQTVIERFIDKK